MKVYHHHAEQNGVRYRCSNNAGTGKASAFSSGCTCLCYGTPQVFIRKAEGRFPLLLSDEDPRPQGVKDHCKDTVCRSIKFDGTFDVAKGPIRIVATASHEMNGARDAHRDVPIVWVTKNDAEKFEVCIRQNQKFWHSAVPTGGGGATIDYYAWQGKDSTDGVHSNSPWDLAQSGSTDFDWNVGSKMQQRCVKSANKLSKDCDIMDISKRQHLIALDMKVIGSNLLCPKSQCKTIMFEDQFHHGCGKPHCHSGNRRPYVVGGINFNGRNYGNGTFFWIENILTTGFRVCFRSDENAANQKPLEFQWMAFKQRTRGGLGVAQGGSRTNFRGDYKDNGRAAASGEWSLYKRADWWKMLGVKGEPQIWRTCRSVSFIRIFQTPPLVLASANHDTAGNDDLLESTYGVSHRPVMTYVEEVTPSQFTVCSVTYNTIPGWEVKKTEHDLQWDWVAF